MGFPEPFGNQSPSRAVPGMKKGGSRPGPETAIKVSKELVRIPLRALRVASSVYAPGQAIYCTIATSSASSGMLQPIVFALVIKLCAQEGIEHRVGRVYALCPCYIR